MTSFRLSRALCAAVGDALSGSHPTLDELFKSSGAPGEPPALSHATKWKEWLFRAGQDSETDSLVVLGNILEEFMDVVPADAEHKAQWTEQRARIEEALSVNGLQYFQGGRVIPNGEEPGSSSSIATNATAKASVRPSSIEELILTISRGMRRAMYPLENRRKGALCLNFDSEYDVQDLFHALLRPWVADIRPEEFTPSYAGRSTRMDFLLPKHSTVIEMKFVRDRGHAKNVGDELIIDISHYKAHPDCDYLWCLVYDPENHLQNAASLNDLEGEHADGNGKVSVRVVIN